MKKSITVIYDGHSSTRPLAGESELQYKKRMEKLNKELEVKLSDAQKTRAEQIAKGTFSETLEIDDSDDE